MSKECKFVHGETIDLQGIYLDNQLYSEGTEIEASDWWELSRECPNQKFWQIPEYTIMPPYEDELYSLPENFEDIPKECLIKGE